MAIKKSNIRYLANILLQIDHTKRKDPNIYFSEVGRQMFSILLVDQDRETSVLPSRCHTLWLEGGLEAPGRRQWCTPWPTQVASLPQGVLKRLEEPLFAAQGEREFLPNCQGLCAVTKSWYHVVVACLTDTQWKSVRVQLLVFSQPDNLNKSI